MKKEEKKNEQKHILDCKKKISMQMILVSVYKNKVQLYLFS